MFEDQIFLLLSREYSFLTHEHFINDQIEEKEDEEMREDRRQTEGKNLLKKETEHIPLLPPRRN